MFAGEEQKILFVLKYKIVFILINTYFVRRKIQKMQNQLLRKSKGKVLHRANVKVYHKRRWLLTK